MAISVTLNVCFFITIVALYCVAGKLIDDNKRTQDKLDDAFEVIESYRMYVSSINRDYTKGVDACVMIESRGEDIK